VRACEFKVLETVIIKFKKHFGDGTNVTEFRASAACLHQGNFTFFCDIIFMTDLLHFDSVGCPSHFDRLFLIYSFCRSRSPPAALMAATFPVCLVLVFLLSNMTRLG